MVDDVLEANGGVLCVGDEVGACSKARVEATACSKAGVEAVACSKASGQ
jgi:hypothetical protein